LDEKLVIAVLLVQGNSSWLALLRASLDFVPFAIARARVGVLLFDLKHAILPDMVKRFTLYVRAAAEIPPMAMCMMHSLSPCPGRRRSGDV
jgi:hypothetical protein